LKRDSAAALRQVNGIKSGLGAILFTLLKITIAGWRVVFKKLIRFSNLHLVPRIRAVSGLLQYFPIPKAGLGFLTSAQK